MDDTATRRAGTTATLLERLAQKARAALFWERLWPPVVALLIVLGVFVAVSWLGLWLNAPRWGRAAGVAAFGLALLWPIFLLMRLRPPTMAEALTRIDEDSGLAHRPATTLADSLANEGADPGTRALWAIHRRRAEQMARSLKVAPPQPRTALHDRFALRAGVLVAVVAAGFVAGQEKYARVAAAFDFSAAGATAPAFRLDAWIDPPAYTGRPPVLLRSAGDQGLETRKVDVPAGSTVIVRASPNAGVTVEAQGGLSVPADHAAEAKSQREPAQPSGSSETEQRWTLESDGELVLRRRGTTLGAFSLVAIPDRPPTIELRGEPRANARGALTLGYRTQDDYGVVSAEAVFASPRIRNRASTRSLADPPQMNLGLPAGPGNTGEAETTADLTEHPWAGARVKLTLTARDEAGAVGRSESVELTLPQRPFVKPLARALVEQRRNLMLFPDETSRVSAALDGLLIAPERFGTSAGHYLALYTISRRLTAARSDDQMREVADLLWQMALQLEEGDLSAAERDLRAAQQALREALERGASDEELRRLMDQLRAALDRFLREFAEQQMRDQQNAQDPSDNQQADRTISSQDLQRMLDQMEKMARSGNLAEAQRMLNQLQNLLENLRTARRGQNQMSQEMNRSLNQLDQMMRDQQELRDRTFQRNQRNDQSGADQDQADTPESLRKRQQALREQLEALQRRMRQLGMKPEQGLEDAEGAMGDAERQLGRGQEGQGAAVDAQGRALEGLRQGAQSLAQQMQQGNQAGDQPGEGDPMGQGRAGRDAANPDPLGRESRDRSDNSRSVYDPAGVPAAQRAQRVLEELRRRLGDPTRPRDELEYLERLLRRY